MFATILFVRSCNWRSNKLFTAPTYLTKTTHWRITTEQKRIKNIYIWLFSVVFGFDKVFIKFLKVIGNKNLWKIPSKKVNYSTGVWWNWKMKLLFSRNLSIFQWTFFYGFPRGLLIQTIVFVFNNLFFLALISLKWKTCNWKKIWE